MGQFILFSYILIFSAGFAGLFSLIVMRIRIRSRVLIPLFAFDALLLLALGIVAVFFYLKNVQALISGEFSSLETALTVVSAAINVSLYAVFLRVAKAALSPHEWRAPASIAFRALCVCAMACLAGETAVALSGIAEIPRAFSVALYALIGAVVTLLGWLLVRAKASGEHSAVRFLLRGTGISCFFFVPLSVLEFILQLSDVQPYHPISVEYVFLLALTVIAVMSAVRSLASDAETRPVSVSDDVAARYALTVREREMVALVARGLTNKEIAYELGISPATVRTHVYNLFQKTGVQSRIGLINKIASDSPTT